MSGVLGNANLARVAGFQYLTVDGTSDTVEIPAGVQFVDLIAANDCYVVPGRPGETPTAVVPSGEKTDADGFYLPGGVVYSIAVNLGTAEKPIKIAAIQVSTGGALYVNYRSMS